VSKSPQIEQLNQSLQDRLKHRQVNVLVEQSADQLNVLLIKLPGASVGYPGLIEAIKSQITTCRVPNIARVKVLGLLQGQTLPEWEQTFPLFPITTAPIVQENDMTVESSPSATPASATPASSPQTPSPQTAPSLQTTPSPQTPSPQKTDYRVSKRWSIGLGLGIAAVFALGYSLGAFNHNPLPDRPNHLPEETLPQK
jgi:hypothetical protein